MEPTGRESLITQMIQAMSEIEIYQSPDKKVELKVNLQNDTVWLTQKQMALFFDCSTDNISLHLKNIFKTEELNANSVTEDSSVTATDGKKYKTKHYNLDAIISLGYRINSQRATQFRQWATQRLKDYLVKDYAMNQRRLEQLQHGSIKPNKMSVRMSITSSGKRNHGLFQLSGNS